MQSTLSCGLLTGGSVRGKPKMQKCQKRRQSRFQPSSSQSTNSSKRAKSVNINKNASNSSEPYPEHPRPTPEECRAVRDTLLAHHGFPKQFIKYRNQRLLLNTTRNGDKNVTFECSTKSEQLDVEDGIDNGDSKESVLDGLVSTILSQNTTDVNSQRAFVSLKSAFPNWEDVLAAEPKHIEDAIRCGGLAPSKASCIKNILKTLFEKRGKMCLEYLRELSVEEIKAELFHFKGIGPKTVACVLMFYLQQDDFPVDTHIFQIARSIGWLPADGDLKKAYIHLNSRIPDHLKFDLNCLLFTHGKVCQQCSRKGGSKKESCDHSCPLLTYCRHSNKK